ncbi:hypothetical protein [Lactococcus formosensis]|uniref:hypothetical protein n=1 Tax=Lactococcus formosensis TaxID=1281486 RepID=UPI00254E2D97|nr:hypothetical protein [Lactococcus formosensis]
MTEKESLLVLNQEIKSDLSFCRDCAVSQGATGWVKDFDRLLDKNEILNNKLNQQFSSHSKLSIPKWVADIFDEFLKDDYDWHDFEMSFVGVDDDDDGLERKFFDWTNSENATELTLAYLNPLTRAFVEVEG